ncbi:MAG TPA: bifunctional phosphoribosylaminoimidazolecarboxamide formyltransferase/IMP cyclohydrolase [Aggregatilineales bacterium]|nr:bifunctional phosphoribosylaminoimidazolecarboxamide formyltransferase/IMP cyclohydrolase [Anaerolineales bacterium]HRE48179.1 bifunctional phosphoribosylaminoimidazolecarboxamide formyltransferase/IMP cyclohydrolase [Aggregatilineales bacterium]
MPTALISVYDKTGLAEYAPLLAQMGWDLVASGGTAKALTDAGIAVTPVETLTGVPEMFGGRVKTLHPAIYAGILAREGDLPELATLGYRPIDLVICNLYPFKETIAKANVTLAEAIEQIDIGGVSLLRAAAKNFERVVVLSDPHDYEHAFAIYKMMGVLEPTMRRGLAAKAFALTREYDSLIAEYLGDSEHDQPAPGADAELPDVIRLDLRKTHPLRYGENPHQKGAFYAYPASKGALGGKVLGGKALSYNNLLDLDAAWRAVESFRTPAVVIVKHMNPAGIAVNTNLAVALQDAVASDPMSAFGGVIAVNQIVDDDFVAAMGDLFVEAIAAPDFTSLAQELLATNRRNCRLLRMEDHLPPRALAHVELRAVRGGVLIQTIDRGDPHDAQWRVVTKRAPSDTEMNALRFAWNAVQAVKSNAIVIANAQTTLGIGGGLPSRVDAARLAVGKAGEKAHGAVMASDAFFPFADGLQVGAEAGITAVIAPGGSVRDADVIAAADEADIAMIFTGIRHFRH